MVTASGCVALVLAIATAVTRCLACCQTASGNCCRKRTRSTSDPCESFRGLPALNTGKWTSDRSARWLRSPPSPASRVAGGSALCASEGRRPPRQSARQNSRRLIHNRKRHGGAVVAPEPERIVHRHLIGIDDRNPRGPARSIENLRESATQLPKVNEPLDGDAGRLGVTVVDVESATCTVKLKSVPADVGVPVMAPELENDNPCGVRRPEVKVQA